MTTKTLDIERWQREAPERRAKIERAAGLYKTQAEAQAAATQHLQNHPGGGEVVIHRPDGQIRNSNTINRPDPDPPRDTRH